MLLKRKMSSKELAEKVGITPANLSILKTGKAHGVRFDTLSKICEVLDCQPGDLLVYKKDDWFFIEERKMLSEKKRQIRSVIGMLILILFFVFINLFEGPWSLPRIILLVAAVALLIFSVITKIVKILKE